MVDLFNRKKIEAIEKKIAASEREIAGLTARLERMEQLLQQPAVRVEKSLDEIIANEWFNGAEGV